MLVQQQPIETLSAGVLSVISRNPVQSAEAVNLIYVKNTDPGIKRIKKGKGFSYIYNNNKVTNRSDLLRIKKLVIPPAWKDVWICTSENGHLQATGFDIKERKQYRYHSLWNSLRNHTKFFRLYDFGRSLPAIRRQIEKDLSLPGMPLRKVLALTLQVMERTNIRVGNDQYEKLYGSYGLTTLKDKHVKCSGSSVKFSFKGKKGIYHSIDLKDKRLARLVRQCRDIPGRELFQYIDEVGQHHSIDSGMVNAYIKEISGSDFSAKDFRTWHGSLCAMLALKELGNQDTQHSLKQNIITALDLVSKQLGNSRNVCRKYYVHPAIISLYENNKLNAYLSRSKKDLQGGLNSHEKMLLKIFEKETIKK